MKNQITAYHGSTENFDKFDTKYIGASAIGYGIHFSTSAENAKMFMGEKGVLYTCKLNLNNPLLSDKISIPKNVLTQIIKYVDENTDGDYLSNYGDVRREGYDKVLRNCLQSNLEYNSSDVDIFNSMVNETKEFEIVANAFIQLGQYNYLLVDSPTWGIEPHKVILMIDTNDISILSKDIINQTNESYRAKFVSDFIKS